MKDSTKRNAAIGAGVAATGGTAAALLLRRKKMPRIGTAVSPSQVVKHMPGKARQVVGRVLESASRLDAVLKNFEVISTEEMPWGGGLCGPSDRPNFPSLYLSRSTNPGLLDMPGEGTAMVQYKVKRREVDESREDGQPLYGASIEIRSIEPVAGMEDEEAEAEESGSELSSTLFLKHFACGGGKPAPKAKAKKKPFGKTALSSREVLRELARGDQFGKLIGKKVPLVFRGSKLANSLAADAKVMRGIDKIKGPSLSAAMQPKREKIAKEARKKLVDVMKSRKDRFETDREVWHSAMTGRVPNGVRKSYGLESSFPLRRFSVARDRDGEGRFASGNVPGADDFAIASQAAKKKPGMSLGKKAAIGAGLATAATAAGTLALRKKPLLLR